MIVDTHLVEFEKFCNRLLIALFGGVQKTTALIHLFFFSMGSGPSFHAIPFGRSRCNSPVSQDGRRKIAELYQKPRRFEMPEPLETGVSLVERGKTARV